MQPYQSKILTFDRWESRFSALRFHGCSSHTHCNHCSQSLTRVKLSWVSDNTNSASPATWKSSGMALCSPGVSPSDVSLQDEGHWFVFPAALTHGYPSPQTWVNISGAAVIPSVVSEGGHVIIFGDSSQGKFSPCYIFQPPWEDC